LKEEAQQSRIEVTRERTKNTETASSWHSTNHSGEGLREKYEIIRQQERERKVYH
jgi:hypothetical protein